MVLDVDHDDIDNLRRRRPKVIRRLADGGGAERVAVPGRLGGISLEETGGWLFVEAAGLCITLRWDMQVYREKKHK